MPDSYVRVRIAFLNTGGKTEAATSLAKAHNVDVAHFGEAHEEDTTVYVHKRQVEGRKIVDNCLPVSGGVLRPDGTRGVGRPRADASAHFECFSSDVRIRHLKGSKDKRAQVLSAEVWVAGHVRLASTGFYGPPLSAGSVDRDEAAYTRFTDTLIEHSHIGSRPEYGGRHLFGGDANRTIGNFGGHRTFAGYSPVGKQGAELRAAMTAAGIHPLHGSPGQPAAEPTSCMIADSDSAKARMHMQQLRWSGQSRPARHGTASAFGDSQRKAHPAVGREVDYVCQRTHPAPGMIVKALPISTVSWLEVPDTHAMLLVDVYLAPLADPDADLPQHAPRVAPRATPAYPDPSYTVLGERLHRMMAAGSYNTAAGRAASADAEGDPEHSWRGIIDMFKEAVAGLPVPVAALQEAVTAAGASLHHRKQKSSEIPLPRDVVAQFDLARTMSTAASKIVRSVKKPAPGSVPLGKDTCVDRLQLAVDIIAQRRVVHRQAERAKRAYLRKWQVRLLRVLEFQRGYDPRRLHRALRALTGANGGGGSIPDEDGDGGDSKFQRFVRALYGVVRTTPPPAMKGSVLSDEASNLVAQADGTHLASKITWQEVYLAVFPPHKSVRAACKTAGCAMCKEYNGALDAWDGTPTSEQPPPHWTPCLHTGRTPGPDGVPAAWIRWARMPDPGSTHSFREHVCTLIAHAFNEALDAGGVPTMANEYLTIPLFKEGKPGGHDPDPGEPNDYRYITIGNLLPKVFDIVLTARLTHWALHHRLIGPEQIGCMPFHNCENHVLALRTGIQQQWADKKDAYALFVDLRKAFDLVHPPLMWSILRTMGVPEALVSVLQRRGEARLTTLLVNSVPGDPIHIHEGIPQGDVLSPLLFAMFIETLNAALRRDGLLKGVRVGELVLKQLLYADDVAILCSSPAEVRLALARVQWWCQMFGMQLGTGNGKTQAMHFPLLRGPAARLSPVTALGVTVDWATAYRYLGYYVTPSLDNSTMWQEASRKLEAQWHRIFTQCKLIRQASPTLQTEIFRTVVLGSCNFLLAVLDPHEVYACSAPSLIAHQPTAAPSRGSSPTTTFARVLQQRIITAGMMATRSRGHLHTALQYDSASITADDIISREQARLYLQTRHPVFPTCLAHKVLVHRQRSPSLAKARGDWLRMVASTLHYNTERFSVPPPVRVDGRPYADLTRVAYVYSRAIAHERWRQAVQHPLVAIGGQAATPMHHAPRSAPPTSHFYDLCGGAPHSHALLSDQRGRLRLSTMSCVGGGMLALVSCHVPGADLRAISDMRLGKRGLLHSRRHGTAFALPGVATYPTDADGLELYCVCEQPYNPSFAMIQCTNPSCHGWFHPPCIGHDTEPFIRAQGRDASWLCPPCRGEEDDCEPLDYSFLALVRARDGVEDEWAPAVKRRRASKSPAPPDGAALALRAQQAQWFRDASAVATCPACGSPEGVCPYHVLTGCTHALVEAARLRAVIEGVTFLPTLVGSLRMASGRANALDGMQQTALVGWLDESPDQRSVMLRLLTVMPWAPDMLAPGVLLPLCSFLAEEFHATQALPGVLRTVANLWVPWAGRATSAILLAWHDAVHAAGLGS